MARDAVAQIMGHPAQQERPLTCHLSEILGPDGDVCFPYRSGRAGDAAPWKAELLVLGKSFARGIEKGVLADATWADDKDQKAIS
ncbi:hypothetical protein MACH01_01890 [Thalassospira tepidiphila]|nr:hypothetical protein MACH01_01890 [Thalassospira tepidiphila]